MPRIFMTNLRSVKNKFDEFRCQLFSLDVDVAICTETSLSSHDTIEAYGIEGYTCHRADREDDSGHGGVAVD